MQIAVVIPTLNEQATLEETLSSVSRDLRAGDHLIISDGGSKDRTLELAESFELVRGERGRGSQLDAGARRALDLGCDLLFFLHADSSLPSGWRETLETAEIEVGGGCLIHFKDASPLLRFGETLVNWRTRRFRRPLGDQGQFATSAAYRECGGYPHWPILEDTELCKRLAKLGPLTILPLAVATNARRFKQRGVVRTVVTNWLIWVLHACGTSAHRLAGLYRNVR